MTVLALQARRSCRFGLRTVRRRMAMQSLRDDISFRLGPTV